MKTRLKTWYHNSILFELRQRTRAYFQPYVSRTCRSYIVDCQTFEVQPDVTMEIYWVEPPVGPGPGASVYIGGDEVMRFDCFGSDQGHYHFNVRQSKYLPGGETTRILYPAGTVGDHIAHAVSDFQRNLDYARAMNLSGRIRRVELDPRAIHRAAETLRQGLREVHQRHAEPPSPVRLESASDR